MTAPELRLAALLGGLLAEPPDPGRPCVVGDFHLNWREMAARALATAALMRPERRPLVFVLASADAASVTGLIGALAAGVAVPLDRETPGLGRLLDLYAPDVVVAADPAPSLAGYEPAGAAPEGLVVLRRIAPAPIVPHPDLGLMLATSGTTGGARFVRLSRRAMAANAYAIAEALAIGPESVGIGHLPLHYSYGLSVLTSHLARGAAFLPVRFGLMDDGFRAAVDRGGGTHFPGVPFHYQLLLRTGLDRLLPPGVTVLTQAGGRLDPAARAKVHALATDRGGRFFVMYGQTEAAPRMTILPSDRFAEAPASVGWPLRGGRIDVVDEAGTILPAGREGEVIYHGPNVMMGYAESRADLGAGDVTEGRLATGDRGVLSPSGCLTLTGRQQRFAKIGGRRLGLDDIEARLGPAVAVLPGEERVEIFHAEPDGEAGLRARCTEMACEQGVPPSSYRLHRLEALPRLPSGKTDYQRLKERI